LVFGESAALGDPEPAFGVSRFLLALLEARLPDRRIEVINTAVTALNSHAVREAARDSRDLKADFWIVYPGNNEVMGPFGPASVPSGSPPSLPLVRLGLLLRQTALGQWIAERQAQSGGGLSLTQRWTGLEQFLERPISADDPRLPGVRSVFGLNLRDILQYGLDSGAQVVVSTMAVNLSDCPPLGSLPLQHTNTPAMQAWRSAVEAGRAADASGDIAAALVAWTNAVALHSADAETRYQLGQARLAANDAAQGRRDLELARDLDTLRFRADSGINQVTREVASAMASDRVLLVDADRDLKGDDLGRPPGADLFFEHVHLRPEGNYALAKLFAAAVVKGLGNPPGPDHWIRMDACLERLGWTPYASARLWRQVRTLVQRPPFSHQSHAQLRDQYLDDRLAEANHEARALGLPAAITRVKAQVERHPDDWELREQLVRLYQADRQWPQLVTEEQEVLRRAPAHVVGWHQLGEAREQAGNREGAIEAFRRALSIRGDFLDARVGLARVYGGQGRYEEALAELNLAVREAPQHLLARVNRGITLLALNRFDEGAAELRQAAQDNPTVPLPLVRLAEALSARKSHGEAAEAYATASARDPGNAALAHREGLERSRAGQLPAAETAFRQSLIRSPEFFTAHVDLGVLLAQQARFTEAIPEFESALRLQPTNAVARQYLDLARQKLQQAGGQ
jgi:tetratricopeptide (TPR) repeat protein